MTNGLRSMLVILLLIVLAMHMASAAGRLDTARIGLQINLSEQDTLGSSFQVSNPDDETVNVSIQALGFYDINKDKKTDVLSLEFDNSSFLLLPDETRTIPFIVTAKECGQFEQNVKFVFASKESNTLTGLNSVLQVNVLCKEKTSHIWSVIIIIAVIVLIVLAFVLFKKKR